MGAIRINCPSCGVKLAVPEEALRQQVRCGRCKHSFVVKPQTAPVIEDVVADWLTEEEEGDEIDLGAAVGAHPAVAASSAGGDDDPLASLETADLAGGTVAGGAVTEDGEIRCVKVERRGAVFEFPAGRLLATAFRSGFPRQCLCCDSRTHLHAHVVIFTGNLSDSISLEAEHSTGALEVSNEEVRGLSDEQILQRIPRVPNVPPPADLPMPYWICDMCSGTGAVSGQIIVQQETGVGRCRLFIRNLRRALEFMTAVGGTHCEGYEDLRLRVDRLIDNPWDNLPEVVRHRLEQWYHAHASERFLTYVPDRDHARAEDGMAGLVISTSRLIYHTPRSHHEAKADEPVELRHSLSGHKGSVNITAPSWEIRHFTLDRDGLAKMRRALTLGRFQAVWY